MMFLKIGILLKLYKLYKFTSIINFYLLGLLFMFDCLCLGIQLTTLYGFG